MKMKVFRKIFPLSSFLLAACSFLPAGEELMVLFPSSLLLRSSEIHAQLGARLIRSGAGVDLVRAPFGSIEGYRKLGVLAEENRLVSNMMVGAFRSLSPSFRLQFTPNDPTLQIGGVLGPWWLSKVKANQAWDLSSGSEKVKVAVIDTGVDLSHPDLQSNLVGGRNFIDTSLPPDDDFGHGTHVAGIVAAAANNGLGSAGLAFRCKVIPIRVLGTSGGTTFDLVKGIDYAVNAGARVINMSLGSSQHSAIEEEAVKKAMNAGIVVVAAAGNDALKGNPSNYPAAIRGVVAVAATNLSDQRADFSNYGSYVTLSAPGVDILSTLPQRIGGYGFASGTSMSAPVVSAAAALLFSLHPDWKAEKVIEALKKGSRDLGRDTGSDVGYDPFFGSGLLDAANALSQ